MYQLHVCVALCIAVTAHLSTSQLSLPEKVPYSSMFPEVCRLLPHTGNCTTRVRRFYYNVTSGQCQPFAYSGCGGNYNRFENLVQCVGACVCSQSTVRVSCSNSNTFGGSTIYYDVISGQCKRLPPDTCRVNNNVFSSVAVCQDTCSLCNLAKDAGPCSGSYQRYNFNRVTGQCQLFHYTGCGGNKNNFVTKVACENKCSSNTPFSIRVVTTQGIRIPSTPNWTFRLSRTPSQQQARSSLVHDPLAAMLPVFGGSLSNIVQRSPLAEEIYEVPDEAVEKPISSEQQDSSEAIGPNTSGHATTSAPSPLTSYLGRADTPGIIRIRLTFRGQGNSDRTHNRSHGSQRQVFTEPTQEEPRFAVSQAGATAA